MTGTCDHCGEPFERKTRGRPRKWCRGACAVAAWREKRELIGPFVAAGVVRRNGHGPELADPLVSLAFDAAPYRTFRVGEELVGVPWFECWLASLDYNLQSGSPLDGAPLNLPSGPPREGLAA